MAIIDMTGKCFARLTVLERAENDKYGNAFWICQCECGNKVRVSGQSLRNGHTKSCGCLQKEKARLRLFKHGRSIKRSTPWNKGIKFEKPPYYQQIKSIFYAMRQRCNNSHCTEYARYGGRGIKICSDWKNFANFYKWALKNNYKDGLTIERIDNDKGYSPDNCRFATRAEQNRNTSRVNRVKDIQTGKTYVTAEVARMIGVSRSTAAKWYREEGLRYLHQFQERYNSIINFNQSRTIGFRSKGMRILPLCRTHHMECHRIGKKDFLDKYLLEPVKADERICGVYGLNSR